MSSKERQLLLFAVYLLCDLVSSSPCIVTPWSVWSSCYGNCEFAWKVRNRDVLESPLPEQGPDGKFFINACPGLYQVVPCNPSYCNGSQIKHHEQDALNNTQFIRFGFARFEDGESVRDRDGLSLQAPTPDNREFANLVVDDNVDFGQAETEGKDEVIVLAGSTVRHQSDPIVIVQQPDPALVELATDRDEFSEDPVPPQNDASRNPSSSPTSEKRNTQNLWQQQQSAGFRGVVPEIVLTPKNLTRSAQISMSNTWKPVWALVWTPVNENAAANVEDEAVLFDKLSKLVDDGAYKVFQVPTRNKSESSFGERDFSNPKIGEVLAKIEAFGEESLMKEAAATLAAFNLAKARGKEYSDEEQAKVLSKISMGRLLEYNPVWTLLWTLPVNRTEVNLTTNLIQEIMERLDMSQLPVNSTIVELRQNFSSLFQKSVRAAVETTVVQEQIGRIRSMNNSSTFSVIAGPPQAKSQALISVGGASEIVPPVSATSPGIDATGQVDINPRARASSQGVVRAQTEQTSSKTAAKVVVQTPAHPRVSGSGQAQSQTEANRNLHSLSKGPKIQIISGPPVASPGPQTAFMSPSNSLAAEEKNWTDEESVKIRAQDASTTTLPMTVTTSKLPMKSSETPPDSAVIANVQTDAKLNDSLDLSLNTLIELGVAEDPSDYFLVTELPSDEEGSDESISDSIVTQYNGGPRVGAQESRVTAVPLPSRSIASEDPTFSNDSASWDSEGLSDEVSQSAASEISANEFSGKVSASSLNETRNLNLTLIESQRSSQQLIIPKTDSFAPVLGGRDYENGRLPPSVVESLMKGPANSFLSPSDSAISSSATLSASAKSDSATSAVKQGTTTEFVSNKTADQDWQSSNFEVVSEVEPTTPTTTEATIDYETLIDYDFDKAISGIQNGDATVLHEAATGEAIPEPENYPTSEVLVEPEAKPESSTKFSGGAGAETKIFNGEYKEVSTPNLDFQTEPESARGQPPLDTTLLTTDTQKAEKKDIDSREFSISSDRIWETNSVTINIQDSPEPEAEPESSNSGSAKIIAGSVVGKTGSGSKRIISEGETVIKSQRNPETVFSISKPEPTGNRDSISRLDADIEAEDVQLKSNEHDEEVTTVEELLPSALPNSGIDYPWDASSVNLNETTRPQVEVYSIEEFNESETGTAPSFEGGVDSTRWEEQRKLQEPQPFPEVASPLVPVRAQALPITMPPLEKVMPYLAEQMRSAESEDDLSREKVISEPREIVQAPLQRIWQTYTRGPITTMQSSESRKYSESKVSESSTSYSEKTSVDDPQTIPEPGTAPEVNNAVPPQLPIPEPEVTLRRGNDGVEVKTRSNIQKLLVSPQPELVRQEPSGRAEANLVSQSASTNSRWKLSRRVESNPEPESVAAKTVETKSLLRQVEPTHRVLSSQSTQVSSTNHGQTDSGIIKSTQFVVNGHSSAVKRIEGTKSSVTVSEPEPEPETRASSAGSESITVNVKVQGKTSVGGADLASALPYSNVESDKSEVGNQNTANEETLSVPEPRDLRPEPEVLIQNQELEENQDNLGRLEPEPQSIKTRTASSRSRLTVTKPWVAETRKTVIRIQEPQEIEGVASAEPPQSVGKSWEADAQQIADALNPEVEPEPENHKFSSESSLTVAKPWVAETREAVVKSQKTGPAGPGFRQGVTNPVTRTYPPPNDPFPWIEEKQGSKEDPLEDLLPRIPPLRQGTKVNGWSTWGSFSGKAQRRVRGPVAAQGGINTDRRLPGTAWGRRSTVDTEIKQPRTVERRTGSRSTQRGRSQSSVIVTETRQTRLQGTGAVKVTNRKVVRAPVQRVQRTEIKSSVRARPQRRQENTAQPPVQESQFFVWPERLPRVIKNHRPESAEEHLDPDEIRLVKSLLTTTEPPQQRQKTRPFARIVNEPVSEYVSTEDDGYYQYDEEEVKSSGASEVDDDDGFGPMPITHQPTWYESDLWTELPEIPWDDYEDRDLRVIDETLQHDSREKAPETKPAPTGKPRVSESKSISRNQRRRNSTATSTNRRIQKVGSPVKVHRSNIVKEERKPGAPNRWTEARIIPRSQRWNEQRRKNPAKIRKDSSSRPRGKDSETRSSSVVEAGESLIWQEFGSSQEILKPATVPPPKMPSWYEMVEKDEFDDFDEDEASPSERNNSRILDQQTSFEKAAVIRRTSETAEIGAPTRLSSKTSANGRRNADVTSVRRSEGPRRRVISKASSGIRRNSEIRRTSSLAQTQKPSETAPRRMKTTDSERQRLRRLESLRPEEVRRRSERKFRSKATESPSDFDIDDDGMFETVSLQKNPEQQSRLEPESATRNRQSATLQASSQQTVQHTSTREAEQPTSLQYRESKRGRRVQKTRLETTKSVTTPRPTTKGPIWKPIWSLIDQHPGIQESVNFAQWLNRARRTTHDWRSFDLRKDVTRPVTTTTPEPTLPTTTENTWVPAWASEEKETGVRNDAISNDEKGSLYDYYDSREYPVESTSPEERNDERNTENFYW